MREGGRCSQRWGPLRPALEETRSLWTTRKASLPSSLLAVTGKNQSFGITCPSPCLLRRQLPRRQMPLPLSGGLSRATGPPASSRHAPLGRAAVVACPFGMSPLHYTVQRDIKYNLTFQSSWHLCLLSPLPPTSLDLFVPPHSTFFPQACHLTFRNLQ